MSPKALKEQSQSRHTIESCTFRLHSWKPFSPSPFTVTTAVVAVADGDTKSKPYSSFHSKRPCLSDRTTTVAATLSSSYINNVETTIDMSKLSLFDYDDDRPMIHHQSSLNSSKRGGGGCGGGGLRSIDRKRRRRHGSRSVSGRSSDGRCLGSNNSKRGSGVYSVNGGGGGGAASVAGASYATCSDFPVAIGTDSSGELFGNGGDANWSSDVSEATKTTPTSSTRRDKDERELLGCVFSDNQGDESGYGSEPGYRADAEIGYDDDEEEDDTRLLFWGQRVGGSDTNMEMVGENNFSEQKSHHRSRRKKHDWTM